ncbi:HicB family protein [Spirochaetia bacterium]|nr:HicB family protein [Spirochaetia bacterium]
MMPKKYIAFIELEKELPGDALGVVFPDFPGCISCGDDFDEAFRMAHEALSFHAEGMREDGLDIPEPRTLEQIEAEWEDFADWKGTRYAVAYINLLPGSETRKYTISMDASLMAQIDAVAKNRSAFLASAARHYIDVLDAVT